jgi:hypothetical protein
MIRRRRCLNLIELDEVGRRCCRFSARAPVGIHPVPIDSIIGTIGRCCDFDRCCNALRPHLRRGVGAVRDAFPDGAVPPIEAFRLDDGYFVLDGHKRVAAARAAGVEFVDADVTQIYARPR